MRMEAERHGWKAKASNLDVDPFSLPFPNRPDPGRGDITLEKSGRNVTFEYRLPEYPDDIVSTVRDIIKANTQIEERCLGKDKQILEV